MEPIFLRKQGIKGKHYLRDNLKEENKIHIKVFRYRTM